MSYNNMNFSLNIHVVEINEPDRVYFEAYCDEFRRGSVGFGDTAEKALSEFFEMLASFSKDVLEYCDCED